MCHHFVYPKLKQQKQVDNRHDKLDVESAHLSSLGPNCHQPHSPPVPPVRSNSVTPRKMISYQFKNSNFLQDIPPRYPIRNVSDADSDDEITLSDVTLENIAEDDYSVVLTPTLTNISRMLSKRSTIYQRNYSDHVKLNTMTKSESNITDISNTTVDVVTLSSPSSSDSRRSRRQKRTRNMNQHIPNRNTNKVEVFIGMEIVIMSPIISNIRTSRAA